MPVYRISHELAHGKFLPAGKIVPPDLRFGPKMASLTSDNPHTKDEIVRDNDIRDSGSLSNRPGIHDRWRSALGDAVSDDSKKILSVSTCGKDFIMADMRFISLISEASSARIVFEIFFDGEVKELQHNNKDMASFVDGIQDRISFTCKEYFRRRFEQCAKSKGGLKEFRNLSYPDDRVQLVGADLPSAFRDAGCMLNFIAVRVSLTPECAQCIGGVVFPEYFGFKYDKPDNEPIPKWILGLGLTTVVFGVATFYAWAQVLMYGNPYS